MSEQSVTRTAPGTAITEVIASHDEGASNAAVIHRRLRIVSVAAAAWALLYAAYRAYYAAGGRFGMFGVPSSDAQWRRINGVGAAILLVAAVAPPTMLVLRRRRAARAALHVLCWIVAVGCIMHALVDMTQCVLSLAGLLTIDRPIWSTIDERQADLQDLLFNEPWFLVEGVLWAAIGWLAGIGRGQHPRRWLATGFGAIAALVAIGLLSATGVLGDLTIA